MKLNKFYVKLKDGSCYWYRSKRPIVSKNKSTVNQVIMFLSESGLLEYVFSLDLKLFYYYRSELIEGDFEDKKHLCLLDALTAKSLKEFFRQ